jgi:ABC-type uncharacterized transport system ATPase subunit
MQVAQERSKEVYLRGVNINFHDLTILEHATLNFQFGHRYGLIGKNGIGKTTLLRHMAEKKVKQRALRRFPLKHFEDQSILEKPDNAPRRARGASRSGDFSLRCRPRIEQPSEHSERTSRATGRTTRDERG